MIGQTDCLRCPVGHICPDRGMMAPRLCPAGFVCEVSGLERAEQPCPEGHYCFEGTATSDTTCGDGTDSSLDGQMSLSLSHAEMTTTMRPGR